MRRDIRIGVFNCAEKALPVFVSENKEFFVLLSKKQDSAQISL